MMTEQKWHVKSKEETLRALDTSEEGLHQLEAKRRLKEFGFNDIREIRKLDLIPIFATHFWNYVIKFD